MKTENRKKNEKQSTFYHCLPIDSDILVLEDEQLSSDVDSVSVSSSSSSASDPDNLSLSSSS